MRNVNSGKLVQGRVVSIAYRQPKEDEYTNATPERDGPTGMWKCPFCFRDDFPELQQVINGFHIIDIFKLS